MFYYDIIICLSESQNVVSVEPTVNIQSVQDVVKELHAKTDGDNDEVCDEEDAIADPDYIPGDTSINSSTLGKH